MAWITVLLSLFLVASTVTRLCNGTDSSDTLRGAAETESRNEICMDDLGCFSITNDFRDWKLRPINVLPKDRWVINTMFVLFTAAKPMEAYRLMSTDESNIKRSTINPNHPTKIIVHGFRDRIIFGPWMEELKTQFLMAGKYNVILVDWSGGDGAPYFQATANCRVVGAEIALLVQSLEEFAGIRREDCHIMGHSLGAHVAGYAGERLTGLGRITGLDPAEPYFQYMPPSVRLDPTDAEFVDVIHSDSKSILLLGFGMKQLCGHVDFFPNNGKNQPGCTAERLITIPLKGLNEGLRRLTSCNHQRAVDFFISSVNFQSVEQVAYPCTSWDDFLQGKCSECGQNGSSCSVMGLRAIEFKPFKNDSNPLKLYLKTSGTSPYWLSHYHVTVKMHKPPFPVKDRIGKMTLVLIGDSRDALLTLNDRNMEFVHGNNYSFLVTTDKQVGDIKGIAMQWDSFSLIAKFLKKDIYIENIRLRPMSLADPEERRRKERTFCDNPKKAIRSGLAMTYYNSDGC